MAKKKEETGQTAIEPVTNCDQFTEVVANCDHLENSETIFSQNEIENLILTIRGTQVLIDRDLAMIYNIETKALNQAVKRNINRFPVDFMFQLTEEEYRSLRSQFVTLNQRGEHLKSQFVTSSWGGTRKRPYAFTRNGVAMLSSVLRSETAVSVNIRIMRAFTAIPQIVGHNAQVMQRIFNIEQHQLETDEKIVALIERVDEISPKALPEQIFPTGCVWDAWAYVSDLVRGAESRIVLIDNFVDDRVLSLFTKRKEGVTATIHTRYNEQFLTDLKKHNTQYPEIEFVQLPHKNHDRFLIIDDKVHFLGASLKDMGTGLCAVSEMSVAPETILGLLG